MYMTTSSVNEYVVLAANEVFYKALSGGSIEGISVARAHDPNVTARAGSARQLEGRFPFDSFAELACAMTNPAIKVHGTIARLVGLERVRGKIKNGGAFAFNARRELL
jgi:hypothetical protein